MRPIETRFGRCAPSTEKSLLALSELWRETIRLERRRRGQLAWFGNYKAGLRVNGQHSTLGPSWQASGTPMTSGYPLNTRALLVRQG